MVFCPSVRDGSAQAGGQHVQRHWGWAVHEGRGKLHGQESLKESMHGIFTHNLLDFYGQYKYR